MTKFKTLYEFSIPKIVESFEETPEINDAGEEITIKKKVQKEEPQQFCLRKPTRALYDDADLYYNVAVSKGAERGLMLSALLVKKLNNSDGVMSKADEKAWNAKVDSLAEKQEELQKIVVVPEEARNEEQKARYKSLFGEIASINKELQNYQMYEQSVFDITAEANARKQTVRWWLLFLLHRKVGDTWVPLFEGSDEEDKLEKMDDSQNEELSEEERELIRKVIDHAYKATALWYYARVGSQDEFVKALKNLDESEKKETDEEPK